MNSDPDRLRRIVSEQLGRRLIVVSNREPFVHSYVGGELRYAVPASGLVAALRPVMCSCGGTWVAHGSGNADRELVDERDRMMAPPYAGNYHLKRVWLSEAEEGSYYYGFANQGLWPLCHRTWVQPRFEISHWHVYEQVNKKFAQAVLEEADSGPAVVFIQDYHFALLPNLLKEKRPDLPIAHFWHIPWPAPDTFACCPWSEQLLAGLLASDLLGFQNQRHCDNFLATVTQVTDSIVDHDSSAVLSRGHRTQVRPFPISVDGEAISDYAESSEAIAHTERLRRELGLRGQLVGLGVDRIDYTKGIPERLQAIDRFLEKYPEYRGRFTFLQVGPVSRIRIDEYKELNDRLDHLAAAINQKYATDQWTPIQMLRGNYPRAALVGFFRLANLCIVSPLDDGMNLVAKEFVAARADGDASLILSQFAGAAGELSDAIIVNPYDRDSFADAIKGALDMPVSERERRLANMRQAVARNNTYEWAAKVFTELSRLSDRQSSSLLMPSDERPIETALPTESLPA